MEREPARPGLGRRAFLAGLGGAAGLVASRGLGVAGWLGSDPAVLSPEQALRELVASFSPRQRELVLLPADHPSRQTANTVAFLSRPHAGSLLDARQFARLERVARGMLSDEGWRRFAQTFAFEGRMAAAVLSIYGDPLRGPAQAVLAGGHYTLRMGNDGLGGALAYGAQIGNGRYRIAGNAFAAHSDAANRFVAALDASELAQARLDTPPSELLL